ncbi:hypothetical protein GCM10011404_16110 [Sphingomonas prati]|uniref:Right handed beta helix domain-containing protein n=2 Tax=Sphingomonas prati TaxID=1843237 RepID=A0A7W9BSJ0_9SPHN|nr:right-handed parallel beta-helix repeat-containing protein [Sphingomonas prati]MBB5729220.1 hypothetical protein [Sphingomonas prati]GGE84203.1 hypothetical protein GCM10011404_16110 [Sphingomonas prati]
MMHDVPPDLSPDIDRRSLLALATGAGTLALLPAPLAAATDENADWPAWAPPRTQLYARLAQLGQAKGRDLRSFGAVMDGRADDSDAVERALASGAAAIRLPALPAGAALRLTRQIRIDRPVAILGEGPSSLIRYEGRVPHAFLAMPQGDDPARFLTGVHIDNLAIERPPPFKPLGVLLQGYNLRDVSVTRCTTRRMGTLTVQHLREKLRLIDYRAAKPDVDPAVAAGFSATRTDDLSDRIFVYDNRVDAGSYASKVVRFNFASRVAVVGNIGRFANISWWGGAARWNQGGAIGFLRRARDIYVADNRLSGANGGVYGNNGDGILVVRNDVRDMLDVGIDFEGCFNAVAENNSVTNAGNFCFATFYAARNILFRDNIGVQDGSAAGLAAAWATRGYGKSTGRALFALRSAGFSRGDGAVDVAFVRNRFRWTGATGFGTCLPSYFDRLRVEGNIFENVNCDLSYGRTRLLALRDNLLRFDRAGDAPAALLGGGALRTMIAGNDIRATVAQPIGTAAILIRETLPLEGLEVSGNRVAAASGSLPIVVQSPSPATAIVAGNRTDALYAARPAAIRGDRNVTAGGAPVRVQPLPSEYQPADPPPAPPSKEPRADAPSDDPTG